MEVHSRTPMKLLTKKKPTAGFLEAHLSQTTGGFLVTVTKGNHSVSSREPTLRKAVAFLAVELYRHGNRD